MSFRVWDIAGKRMLNETELLSLTVMELFAVTADRKSYHVLLSTEKDDRKGVGVFEGDIIQNPNGMKMIIRYGVWQAYCPVDKAYMDSVGFYAEAPDYPQMPVGSLEDYATVIGNIFENPELMED